MVLLALGVAALLGQQTAPPDILTSQTSAAIALGAYKAWAEGQINALWAAQAPHITEYTIETATGNGGAWALTSTESEMFGTRRIVHFQNVKQIQLCFNLGAGGGPGASIHLDESYDWTITSAEGTWTQILGPIDISSWRVGCTPWTPYTGNQVDAFVRIRGSSPNPAAAQFMNIALEVQ